MADREKEIERKTLEVVAAILRKGDCIFGTEKGYGEWKGFWEFPGGKVEAGERPEELYYEKYGKNSMRRFGLTVCLKQWTLTIPIFMCDCTAISAHYCPRE